MPQSYTRHYGIDWPEQFSRPMAALTIAKKWRLLKADLGVTPDRDPGDCLEEAVSVLLPSVRLSAWTQLIIHDFVDHDFYAMIGCGSSGKSHAMAACGLLMWICDPFDTAVVVGSATLKDLSTRAWAPMLELFTELKNNREGVPIPGKVVNNAYAIVNERDSSMAETVAIRASIQGRALDEGRVQGLHVPWVYLLVDELALVRDIEALKTGIANIQIGTRGFKFVSAANPDPWEMPNSCFYIPPKDTVVTVDTGTWTSAMGYFVRHFDGTKSPVVLDPSLKPRFPFLMSKENIDNIRSLCNGDDTAPRFWKMVRGFPRSSSGQIPTVLDPIVAVANKVTSPPDEPMSGGRTEIGLAAGVDPAWSEDGDDAIYAGVRVIEQDGRPILDFTGRSHKLPLTTKTNITFTQQLRDQVVSRMSVDRGPALTSLYVDSSGNQGLADNIDIYVGSGCGHINASERASDLPLRAMDNQPASRRVKDRQAEAWFVLSEFCRAGMVRGLPQGALDGLIRRRWVVRPNTTEPTTPLRLEPKEEFVARFKGSPNETDGCALAALAVKERMGVLPYGSVPAPQASAIVPQAYTVYGGVTPPAEIPEREYEDDAYSDIELHEGDD